MRHRVGLGLFLLAAPLVRAQIPDEFTNLKVLPKEVEKQELVQVMRGFAGALGVRCKHCHVGESEQSLEGYDFASDKKETKETARVMMRMVDRINDELLPATGREDLVEVECVTCHRGIASPRTLEDRILAAVDEDGIDGAVSLYRELREEHYGGAAYDFSPNALNAIAETLSRERGDVESAVALVELGLELDPDVASSHFMLGRLQAGLGDRESALASFERAVELDPENPWYANALERLRQTP